MIRVSRLALYRALRAVALFQDPARAHLCGVRFEADRRELHLVATDGHTLGRATLRTCGGDLQAFTLPSTQVATLLTALKCKPREDCEVTIGPGIGEVRFTWGYPETTTVVCLAMDRPQDFPPWRVVTPERGSKAEPTVVGLNPVYFARAGKAATYFAGGKGDPYKGLELTASDGSTAVRFDYYGAPDTGDLCVLIMPMRI